MLDSLIDLVKNCHSIGQSHRFSKDTATVLDSLIDLVKNGHSVGESHRFSDDTATVLNSLINLVKIQPVLDSHIDLVMIQL